MRPQKGEVWFLASCVELCKTEKGLTGQESFNYLAQTGALQYITECWEGLHMTGPQNIIESVDEYVKNHSVEVIAS